MKKKTNHPTIMERVSDFSRILILLVKNMHTYITFCKVRSEVLNCVFNTVAQIWITSMARPYHIS